MGADCEVVRRNHVLCSCPRGFSGDPAVRCDPDPGEIFVTTRPDLASLVKLQGSVLEVAGPVSQEDQDQSEEEEEALLWWTRGLRSGSATNCPTVTLTSSARELQAGVSTLGKDGIQDYC